MASQSSSTGLEFSTKAWGKSKFTHDFHCVCSYTVVKTEKKAKERLQRLHLKTCAAGQEALKNGLLVNFLNDISIRNSGQTTTVTENAIEGLPTTRVNHTQRSLFH